MFFLKVTWQLPNASDPSLFKLQPPCFLALPWHPHSCNMKDTQATCHALHQLHNPVVLEELDVIMSKRQVKKKDTLYNRKGRA